MAMASPAAVRAGGRAGLTAAMRSEFLKLRTLRATWLLLPILALGTIGIGMLACAGAPSRGMNSLGFDPVKCCLLGLVFGQPVISVLGALTITSEYSSGLIRTSLVVQPRRGILLIAKGLVLALVTLATGLAITFTAFCAGQAILSGKHVGTTLGHPGALRALIGGALFLTVCALLGYGFGVVIRHTGGAIAASVGLPLALSLFINFLPGNWQLSMGKWAPFSAGSQIWGTGPADPTQFPPWAGFAVFADYALIILVAGVLLFHRRDA